MKRTLAIATLVLVTLFGFSSTASAGDRHSGWGFGVGFGTGGFAIHGGYSRGYRYPRHRYVRHVCSRVPIYTRVWVPPVYDTVCVGHDRWGYPIRRTVLVSAGYYQSVVNGYRCGSCGVGCR
jgi:hypothetical protein